MGLLVQELVHNNNTFNNVYIVTTTRPIRVTKIFQVEDIDGEFDEHGEEHGHIKNFIKSYKILYHVSFYNEDVTNLENTNAKLNKQYHLFDIKQEFITTSTDNLFKQIYADVRQKYPTAIDVL